jgi:hypothetical protein
MLREGEEGSMSQMLRRSASTILAVGLVAVAALAGSSPAAAAPEEIKTFTTTPSNTQAGGHPDIFIRTTFSTGGGFLGYGGNPQDARSIATHLPTGVIGNPHAVPACPLLLFALNECPSDSQIGLAKTAPVFQEIMAPIYNLEPKPDQAGLIGFKIHEAGTTQYVELSGRTNSDYGLDSISTTIFHSSPIDRVNVDLWGVPADPSHDPFRFITTHPPSLKDCPVPGGFSECSAEVLGTSSSQPPEPYLQNPTTCGVPLSSSIEIEFYTGVVKTAEAPWPATTGCDQLAFNPSLTAKPTTTEADTPTGLDVDLEVPQVLNPYSPSPSQIRGVTVTLPEGFSLNPNAADGKTDCIDANTSIGTRNAATCPEFSKVGTLSINSSALPGPLPGAIYLGEPKPGDPYRLILAASGYGTNIKLAGSAKADPQTGQLVVAFEDLPQSPLTEFNMHFFGSERGLLATPPQCGEYPVVTEFEPWNSVLPNQTSTSFFHVDSGPKGSVCATGARPFSPGLVAGTSNPTAGRHTQFNLNLSREDGEQNLTGLTVATPLGFSGRLQGIPYCPEAALNDLASGTRTGILEQAEPACPLESQIGTVVGGTGAGTHPLYSPGKVYLAGPYKGAPLSLIVVIPAVSGPYDLGLVAVRAAIEIDPITARVTTISDPFPQILGGIPLRTRSFRIELNRPSFALNPTNCDPLSTDAQVSGSELGLSSPSAHFQAANCTLLPFEPKLSLTLSGGVKRRGHPAIKAVLTAQQGEANLKSTSVALPAGELLDNSHIGTICTRPQFAANTCPEGSLLGTAEAITPLLDAPLKGNVYLRSSSNDLPDLVADLEGQIDIEVAAKIDTLKGGSLRTTFGAIPDTPVTQFTLNLFGGSRGLLVNSKTLCGKPKYAVTKMTGQNAATLSTKTKLKVKCGKKSARHKRSTKKSRRAGA